MHMLTTRRTASRLLLALSFQQRSRTSYHQPIYQNKTSLQTMSLKRARQVLLSAKNRMINASKNQQVRTLFVVGALFLVLQLPHRTPSTLGDYDLEFLKTDPELTKRLVQLSSSQQQDAQDTALATRESNGFFTDISTRQWNMLKLMAQSMQPNTRGNPLTSSSRPETWFQEHYEPEFSCAYERRIGRLGDGGKWVCDPHRITSKNECLVYSIGSNGDASFEAAILQDVSSDCEIHVFDFDDYSESVQQQTNHSHNVHYHQWGLSSTTGGIFKSMKDTVNELGHEGRTINIFKMDCEGCELETFWLDANVKLQQVLVEIHPSFSLLKPFVKLPETVELFRTLHDKGYVITHKEPNIQFAGSGTCVEYNFLLLSTDFWNNQVPGK